MRKIGKYIFLFLLALLVAAVVYRYQIYNNFSFEFGYKNDDIIAISVLEHWYNVIFGSDSWVNTKYFYPYQKTIGYSDAFFLLGCVYSLVRFVGVEPILSNEITGMVFHVIGFMAFYIMLREVWKFKKTASFFAASVICLSNNMWTQSIHLQLYVAYVLPVIVILFHKALDFLKENKIYKCLIYFGSGCVVYGACIMTGFYLVWFFTFFSLIVLLVYVFFSPKRQAILAFTKAHWPLLIPASLFMLISIFPLFYVYLEKARETGMQPWWAVRYYIFPVTSLINIGKYNIMYHWIMVNIPDGGYNKDGEFSVAFTPLLVVCIFYAIFSKKFNVLSGRDNVFWKALFLALGVSVFLSVHVSKFYPWYVVYHLVPGAKSMRVVARFMLFLSFPVSVVFALFLNKLESDGKKLAAAALGIFVLCEQLNAAPIVGLDRVANSNFYNSLPSPPHLCKSFFVIDNPPKDSDNDRDGVYTGNVSAMLYAELHHIPTVNGFTTFYPGDWHFDHLYLPDIRQRAQYYAHIHHIEEGFCALNLVTKQWDEEPFK